MGFFYFRGMREDLLHFIWKYKKLQLQHLATSQNETIEILDVGTHNQKSGPDFFNAKLKINGQLWAGNVEIHINSSDWYAHHHEKDVNYENVILHVVWNHDLEVHRRDNTLIPTLELNRYVSEDILKSYSDLFDKRRAKFVNCENGISKVDDFTKANWLERLYIERLEQKSILIHSLLESSKNDWEKVLFCLLLKNFGLNVNATSFLSIAQTLDFSVVRKLLRNPMQLESALLGLAGLLANDEVIDPYYITLQKEYGYLSKKFGFNPQGVQKPEFFKLRPANFPTIRLSQLANLYERHQNLFQKLISTESLDDLYVIFEISASSYWDDHFTFGKLSKKSKKKLTKSFIDLLVINTVLPLRFCYAQNQGKDGVDVVFSIVEKIKKEENRVVDKFIKLGLGVRSSGESQAALQLYNEYCTKNKCLQCAIGSNLLHGNI